MVVFSPSIPESLLFRVGWRLPCNVQHRDTDTVSTSTDGRGQQQRGHTPRRTKGTPNSPPTGDAVHLPLLHQYYSRLQRSPEGTSVLQKMDSGTIFSVRRNTEEYDAGENKPVYHPFPKSLRQYTLLSEVKSNSTIRMIHRATELYHSNYIRSKFTIEKRRKITRSNPPKQQQCHC